MQAVGTHGFNLILAALMDSEQMLLSTKAQQCFDLESLHQLHEATEECLGGGIALHSLPGTAVL